MKPLQHAALCKRYVQRCIQSIQWLVVVEIGKYTFQQTALKLKTVRANNFINLSPIIDKIERTF